MASLPEGHAWLLSALILAVISMNVTSAMCLSLCTSWQWWATSPNEWKYGILRAAEEVVRAGVLSYAPGSESERVSPVSQFIDWSGFVGWLVVGVWLFVCFAFVVFLLGSLTNLCDRVINR